MKFHSTRSKTPTLTFSDAINEGLAPDGGLYVPEHLPTVDVSGCCDAKLSFARLAEKVLAPFLNDDPLESKLGEICSQAFDFPVPLANNTSWPFPVLELFHGPTAAFKDVGARFLAQSLARILETKNTEATILVATSGDTGGAVASAFFERPRVQVKVLFPKGAVSPLQKHQLTCWGKNISSFEVEGDFDDCQRIVKEAFSDPVLKKKHHLTSANSISIGRLLPQITYYAYASLQFYEHNGKPASIAIPSGNIGNSVAALLAKRMGFPIDQIAFCTNANRAVRNYFETGNYQGFPTIKTMANAMDVGNPSNMERIFWLYPSLSALKRDTVVSQATDAEITKTIEQAAREFKTIWCPHTAAAGHFLLNNIPLSEWKNWILVATAHPAKFADSVQPILNGVPAAPQIPIPSQLTQIAKRPSHYENVSARLEDFVRQAFDRH